MPFLSEAMYQELRKKMPLKEKSVHLTDWPRSAAKKTQGEKMIADMRQVRIVVAEALKLRAEAGIRVRQPLAQLQIVNQELKGKKELLALIQDEVNVKEITFGKEAMLDTAITPELKEEGMVREFVRTVQDMRRDLGLKPQNVIGCQISGSPMLEAVLAGWEGAIKKDINARELKVGGKKVFKAEREIEIGGENIWIGIS